MLGVGLSNSAIPRRRRPPFPAGTFSRTPSVKPAMPMGRQKALRLFLAGKRKRRALALDDELAEEEEKEEETPLEKKKTKKKKSVKEDVASQSFKSKEANAKLSSKPESIGNAVQTNPSHSMKKKIAEKKRLLSGTSRPSREAIQAMNSASVAQIVAECARADGSDGVAVHLRDAAKVSVHKSNAIHDTIQHAMQEANLPRDIAKKASKPLMPRLLVICASAERCANVSEAFSRDAPPYRLLPAKKKTVDEHASDVLAAAVPKCVTPAMAVSTPHRAAALIERDAVSLSKLDVLAVDVTPDVKNRSLLDMVDVTPAVWELVEQAPTNAHVLFYSTAV